MMWDENNGDRKAILALAQPELEKKAATTNKSAESIAITKQLVDHLTSMGINVHNREEMIQYLNEHGYNSIQEAVKRTMYNFDLTLSEKNAIRKYIESLSKETDTSKGLYYVDKKKGFVYWFNTSLIQYNDNRALNRDGFEIINKYDISNLNKQDQNNIDDGLKQPKQSINRIIAQFGLSQRINDDSIIVIDYGEGEDISDSLDKQASTGDGRTSNQGSRKNKGKEHFFITSQGVNPINSGGNIQPIERRRLLTKSGNNLQDNTFVDIDKAIMSGKWSDKALDELENLNTDSYDKILKRFSQEELRGSNENLIQAEAIIQRGERGADRKNTQGYGERAKQQEQQIESWALME